MADQSDVRDTLAILIAAALFPSGGDTAITGQNTKVLTGFPNNQELSAITSPTAPVTAVVAVWPDPAMTRNTTRYNDAGQTLDAGGPASTMTAIVADPVVTFHGTPAVGQAVGIGIGRPLVPYAYRVPAGATLASVATAIAALILGATASGSSVTMPTSLPIAAEVLMDGQGVMQPLRQEDMFHASVWTASPTDRDTLASAVLTTLAPLTFITLPDGTAGRIKFQRRSLSDKNEKSLLYWADLTFSVEYATTITIPLTRALFVHDTINTATMVVGSPPV